MMLSRVDFVRRVLDARRSIVWLKSSLWIGPDTARMNLAARSDDGTTFRVPSTAGNGAASVARLDVTCETPEAGEAKHAGEAAQS